MNDRPPLFQPILVGEFLKSVSLDAQGNGFVRWIRTSVITSLSVDPETREIRFSVDESDDHADLVCGRLADEKSAQKELFDLMILISPNEKEEEEKE